MACAAHLAAGGWVALLQPWFIVRPGRRPEIEMKVVGVLQGGMK
jgi:hypothetical protein